MIIQGIKIITKCEIDCRLKYMVSIEKSCSLCKHYKKIDIPKVIEEVFKLKAEADNRGKVIEEVHIKDDRITTIIYETIWEKL